jgi:Ca2+-binding EF-hand superfamily protein
MITLCLLTAATAKAQSPGAEDDAPPPRRTQTPPARDAEEPMEEDEADSPGDRDERGERRRAGRDGEERPGGDRFGGFRRGNPMFEAIDADGDQVITNAELRRAIAALKKLDADGDGNITIAEVSPPGGPGGPGGRGPFGGDPSQFVDGIMQRSDRNQDGRLTLNEVDERTAMMLANADTNGDKAIDRAELEAAMRQRMGGGQFGGGGGPFGGGGFDGRQMTERMMANDRNGDGKLSPDEVPEQMQGMLRGADQNGDGTIDASEMEQATRRMGERFGGGRPGRGDRGDRGARDDEAGDEGERPSRRRRPEAEE